MPRLMTPMKWRVMCQYIDYPMGAAPRQKYRWGIESKEEAEKIAEEMNPKKPTSCGTVYWVEEDK
jgi:hypothetical protein